MHAADHATARDRLVASIETARCVDHVGIPIALDEPALDSERAELAAAEHIDVLRQAWAQMLCVMPRVEAIGGAVPRDPMTWVAELLERD